MIDISQNQELIIVMAKLNLKVTQCINNKKLITNIIIQAVIDLYNDDKFESFLSNATDDAAFLYFNVNNVDEIASNKIFINTKNINYISRALKDIK